MFFLIVAVVVVHVCQCSFFPPKVLVHLLKLLQSRLDWLTTLNNSRRSFSFLTFFVVERRLKAPFGKKKQHHYHGKAHLKLLNNSRPLAQLFFIVFSVFTFNCLRHSFTVQFRYFFFFFFFCFWKRMFANLQYNFSSAATAAFSIIQLLLFPLPDRSFAYSLENKLWCVYSTHTYTVHTWGMITAIREREVPFSCSPG